MNDGCYECLMRSLLHATTKCLLSLSGRPETTLMIISEGKKQQKTEKIVNIIDQISKIVGQVTSETLVLTDDKIKPIEFQRIVW